VNHGPVEDVDNFLNFLDFSDNKIKPRIAYWLLLSDKAKKTIGYDAAGEKISYNPEGYVGCNVVTGLNVFYAF